MTSSTSRVLPERAETVPGATPGAGPDAAQDLEADLASDPLRAEVRTTIHRLNNLLTTILIRGDALLASPVDERAATAVRAILATAEEAEAVLRTCRERVLGPGI